MMLLGPVARVIILAAGRTGRPTGVWIRRELLVEEGSIWVSIDDNEGHYSGGNNGRVFGEEKDAQENYSILMSDNHDHIFCYSNGKLIMRPEFRHDIAPFNMFP